MKKIFLTGTILAAFAAASSAQTNTTTTNQNGNKQTALQLQNGSYLQSAVTQDKGNGSNYGSFGATRQEGTGSAGNKAMVDQNANSNSNRGYVTQVQGTGNTGSITQSNFSGGGSLPVTANTSSADVRGAGGNWGGIYQQGSNNTGVSINQSNTSSKNFGEIAQYGDDNQSTTIEQSTVSSNNEARINQGSANNAVFDNRARVQQSGNSRNNKATVDQQGSYGIGKIEQNNNSRANEATISQLSGSYYETASVYQGNVADNNKATVKQSGFFDQATIYQTDRSSKNEATIEQHSIDFGYGNSASIYQQYDAVKNQATIKQDGTNNNANVNQFNVSNSKATITQSLGRPEGGFNTAEIQQGSTYLAASNNNTATIAQDFSQNVAKLRQYGNGNEATFSQVVGDLNVIKGLGDSPYALQQGNNNTLTVTQNSGNGDSSYVPNTASVSQIGNGNMATIMQTGRNQ